MDYETIKTENQLLKDENDRLKNELTQTKEHFKKYTAPEYKKVYYENNKYNNHDLLKYNFYPGFYDFEILKLIMK